MMDFSKYSRASTGFLDADILARSNEISRYVVRLRADPSSDTATLQMAKASLSLVAA